MVSNYVDLIVLGMVALFLVLRLRSILGRRTGFERPEMPQPPAAMMARAAQVIDGTAVRVNVPPARPLPEPGSPAGQGLQAIRAQEPSFDPAMFLMGAEAAFNRIVKAFAAGDRNSLKPLLTPETFAAFEGAIAAREQAGETQVSEIRTVLDVIVEQAGVRPRPDGGPDGAHVAMITVRFVSHQVNMTKDRKGEVIAGTDGITEMVDIWGFERVLGTAEPTWRLASAQSA
jgi:predicted lipid-binding transport protein (Tim44 family)